MSYALPALLSRASGAFSSLAVTAAIAALTILSLALGTVQDSKAETTWTASVLGNSRVEDLALELTRMAVSSLPERSVAAGKSASVSRTALSSEDLAFLSARPVQSPAQEWMGMSKLAFPLLVNDLVGGQVVRAPRVMTGQTVGVVK